MSNSLREMIRENVSIERLKEEASKSNGLLISSEIYFRENFNGDIEEVNKIKHLINTVYDINELYDAINKVNPTFYKAMLSGIDKKMLRNDHTYTREEVYENYPTWMTGYATSHMEDQSVRTRAVMVRALNEEIKHNNDSDDILDMIL